jgi:hypothetical protein
MGVQIKMHTGTSKLNELGSKKNSPRQEVESFK